MMCPYLLISINELLISIIPFIDINKYGLNVKTAAHKNKRWRLLNTDSVRAHLCLPSERKFCDVHVQPIYCRTVQMRLCLDHE